MSTKKPTFFFIIFIFIKIFITTPVTGQPVQPWYYYFKKGILQYKAGMYNYAILNLEKALKKNPNNFSSANLLGNIYLKKNHYDKALEYYTISIHIKPNQDHIHYILGDLYENYFYDISKAQFHYRENIRLNPANAKCYSALARIAYSKGEKKNYTKLLQKSYQLGNEQSRTVFIQGQKFQASARDNKAIAEYRKAISINPAMTEAYMALVQLYRKQNDYMNAVHTLEQLIYNQPDHELAYLLLAKIYFNRKLQGNTRKYYIDRAQHHLLHIIKLNPDNYDAYILLARIYYLTGHKLKARAVEQKAQQIQSEQE